MYLVAAVLGLMLVGCIDNRETVSGPAIQVHCAGQTPLGVGDTNVKTVCPP